MRTSRKCLPCFMKQAEASAALVTEDPAIRQLILKDAATILQTVDFRFSPPENAIPLYRMIAERSGVADPFADLKTQSNDLALSLLPDLEERVDAESDPLYAAAKVAIAGNVIDYGAQHPFDAVETLSRCFQKTLRIDHFKTMQEDLAEARNLLYLADNSGEICFDGLFISRLDKKIILAVKERPIINDALPADARYCGIDRLCRVITNGTDCPGTPLGQASDEFMEIFHAADIIISKGQGNFETLSEVDAPIYFLLTVKCPVVAEHIRDLSGHSVELGDSVLMRRKTLKG